MHQHPDQAGQPGRQPRGRAACIRLVSISGALLAAVAIAGCHHAQAIPVPGPAPTNTAGPTPPPDPTSANTPCTPWSGLSYLTDAYVDMGQLAGDEGTYGIGSEQVNSDQLGVNADQAGLTQYFQELPTAYGEAVQNEVIAVSPDDASPQQLTAAAADALSLYSSISALCPSS